MKYLKLTIYAFSIMLVLCLANQVDSAWYNSSWSYKKAITLEADQIATTTSAFPLLATTTDADLKTSTHGGKVQNDNGYDIIFVDDDETTLLNYEKEKYASTTGEIAYWINTDISSTTDKTIYMYYGNPSASDTSTTTGVWDDNFKMVQHLQETDIDNDAGDIKDSTKYANNGTTYTMDGTDQVVGQIDGSFDFDGTGDYVDAGNVYNGAKTVSFWLKADTTTEKIFKLNSTQTIEVSGGTIQANNFTSPTIYIDGTVSSTIDTNWRYITITTGTGINASAVAIGKINTETTTSYYVGAGDGFVESDASYEAWDTAHDNVGVDGWAGPTDTIVEIGVLRGTSAGIFKFMRGFLPIDTSGIPDTDTITAATLYVYGYTGTSNHDNDGDDWIGVVQTDQAATNTLVSADYDQCGTIDNPTEAHDSGDRIDVGSWSTSGYNSWAFNATGLGWINKTGYTKLGLREGHDCIDSPIVVSNNYNGNRIKAYTSEQTGTANDPYLSVTYSATSYFNGLIDEPRISDTARSAQWISTEYSNQSDMNAFLIFGSEEEENQNPTAPSSLAPSNLVDGSYTSDTTPTLTFTLAEPDASDTVKYQIQIDDSSDFLSAIVDYTSALATQGSFSFTVGQAVGSGTYTTGSESQTLSETSYYWRVKTIDNSDAESNYTTANSGSVAFIIDTTAPTPSSFSSAPSSGSSTSISMTATSATDVGVGSIQYQFEETSGNSGATSSSWQTSSIYTDTGLTSNTTYFYKTRTRDFLENTSSYSSISSATTESSGGGIGLPPNFKDPPLNPSSSSSNPKGEFKIIINPDQPSSKITDNPIIKLKFIVGKDTKMMSVSEDPDFTNASLIPYEEEVEWDLSTALISNSQFSIFNQFSISNDQMSETHHTIYVKFYTKYGYATEAISATIILVEDDGDSRLRGNDREENGNDREENGNDREENGNDREENGNDREENGNDREEIFAYNKPRLNSLAEEQNKAQELKQELEQHYGKNKIPVHRKHWHTIVNSFVYGNYPINAIIKAIKFGGKTVHPTIPFSAWQNARDYLDYINQ